MQHLTLWLSLVDAGGRGEGGVIIMWLKVGASNHLCC